MEIDFRSWSIEDRCTIETLIRDKFCNEAEYEYSDNVRYARMWRGEEVEDYNERFKQGCCGFHDEMIFADDGIILFGFNYGH